MAFCTVREEEGGNSKAMSASQVGEIWFSTAPRDRCLGLSGAGASRKADLKCFQTDITLQGVRPPVAAAADPECGKGTRLVEFRHGLSLLSPPPRMAFFF